MYTCVFVCGYVHMCANVCGVQKRVSDAQELEFQVSYQIWMLRTKLRSFTRTVHALTPELSPVPLVTVLK